MLQFELQVLIVAGGPNINVFMVLSTLKKFTYHEFM